MGQPDTPSGSAESHYIVMSYIVMSYIVMAYIVMAYVVMAYVRVRKYLQVAVNMALVLCRFWRSTTCPKTLIVTLGDVLESGNAKNRVNSAIFFCLR